MAVGRYPKKLEPKTPCAQDGRTMYGGSPWSRLVQTIIAILFSLACWAWPAVAQPKQASRIEPKRVMVLHSFGRDFKPWSEYATAIRAQLNRQSPWRIDIVEHSLVTARSSDDKSEKAFVAYLGALFAERLPDLIISVGAPAAAFVQRHRPSLFADTPMVFTAVDERRVQFSSLTANDAVVAVRIDYLAAFENILRVLPDTRNITVVVGTSPIEQFWKAAIARQVAPVANKVTLSWTDQLSFDRFLGAAANLPPDSAIFWELMIVDADGVVHEGNVALSRLHSVANAPIFSYDEAFFGRETVGGPFLRVTDTGSRTAAVAVRILGGEKAGEIKVPPVEFGRPMFDWRELQRWNIPESRLPPGSEVHFRVLTAWEQYRLQILLVAVAIALQGGLILWLFHEHRRRRIAEADSLQRLNELARLNRASTAGELSASIAHEIRQPLAAIATSGSAGLNWLRHKVPNIDEARQALEAIIKDSHRADDVLKGVRAMFARQPTERVPVNINDLVRQVLLLVEHQIRTNNVTVRTSLSDEQGLLVLADPIQLQQVILNLIVNAIEAMSTSHDRARMLLIETRGYQTDSILLSIQDSGPGLDAKVIDRLFKPFVTTKSNGMGMGLSISKSIIEQHGGNLTAASAKSQGALFQIILTRSA